MLTLLNIIVKMFRKKNLGYYSPSISMHGYGEDSFKEDSSSDGVLIVSRVFKSSSEVASGTLPYVPASSIVNSGNYIDGRVSFAPQDHALIDSQVNSALSDFISKSLKSSKS